MTGRTNAVVTRTSAAFYAASWAEINAVAQSGRASQAWALGDAKEVTLTTGETILIRIEDFDHDDLAGGGKAPLTLGMSKCLNAGRQMNGSASSSGGWGQSAMRAWMPTLLGQLPSDLRALIKQAQKKTCDGYGSSHIEVTSDPLWLFSEVEVRGSTFASAEGEGTLYPLFRSDAARIKTAGGAPSVWWLRSPHIGTGVHFCSVDAQGVNGSTLASGTAGVSVGFCI